MEYAELWTFVAACHSPFKHFIIHILVRMLSRPPDQANDESLPAGGTAAQGIDTDFAASDVAALNMVFPTTKLRIIKQ